MLIPLLDAMAVSFTHGITILLASLIFYMSLWQYLHFFDTYHLDLAEISKVKLLEKMKGHITSLHGTFPPLFCEGLTEVENTVLVFSGEKKCFRPQLKQKSGRI